ncbi:hypothetical protein ABZ802_31235 [Streptomyces sp. NPDC047737]|uniref:hypothetical protein n=1 Tax=Streptomyces sp. NPDC047737 TaxID=3155740 RepID=UPI003407C9D6
MASSRTFSSQLRRAHRTVIVTAVSIALGFAYLAASIYVTPEAWGPVLWTMSALLVALGIPYIWVVRAMLREMGRQQDLAPSADRLREASQEIPAGHSRIYADHERGWVVHCKPNLRGADCFSRFEVADLEDLGRADLEGLVGVSATTYRVMRRPAVVWRNVWADEVVRTSGEGELCTTVPDQEVGVRDRLKVALFNHRTGALTPDAGELGELVSVVCGADRTWDIEESR